VCVRVCVCVCVSSQECFTEMPMCSPSRAFLPFPLLQFASNLVALKDVVG